MAPSTSAHSDAYRNSSLPFPLETSGRVSRDDLAKVAPLAAELLADPVALMRLSDRIVELLGQDIRFQQERRQGYRSRL